VLWWWGGGWDITVSFLNMLYDKTSKQRRFSFIYAVSCVFLKQKGKQTGVNGYSRVEIPSFS